MSHHLSPLMRERIHLNHIQNNAGAWETRRIEVKVPLADFQNPVHELIVRTHALQAHHRQQASFVSMTIEVCASCGFIEKTTCDHGLSFWTHRPGCLLYDPDLLDLPLALVRPYAVTIGAPPTANCGGCLLLCPVCKNDGT